MTSVLRQALFLPAASLGFGGTLFESRLLLGPPALSWKEVEAQEQEEGIEAVVENNEYIQQRLFCSFWENPTMRTTGLAKEQLCSEIRMVPPAQEHSN